MSETNKIKYITEEDIKDYLRKLIKVYDLEVERAKAKRNAIHDLLFELNGYKIMEDK